MENDIHNPDYAKGLFNKRGLLAFNKLLCFMKNLGFE